MRRYILVSLENQGYRFSK